MNCTRDPEFQNIVAIHGQVLSWDKIGGWDHFLDPDQRFAPNHCLISRHSVYILSRPKQIKMLQSTQNSESNSSQSLLVVEIRPIWLDRSASWLLYFVDLGWGTYGTDGAKWAQGRLRGLVWVLGWFIWHTCLHISDADFFFQADGQTNEVKIPSKMEVAPR